MDPLLSTLAIVAYVGVLAPERVRARLGRSSGLLLPIGLLLHALALAWAASGVGVALLASMRGGLGLFSLGLLAVWALVERRGPRSLEVLRPVVMPVGLVLLGASLFAPLRDSNSDLHAVWFPVHITLLLAGFILFGVAFVGSAGFLAVRRRLKAKDLSEIGRMPSLDLLDTLAGRAMVGGMVALSAGIVVGLLWGFVHGTTRAVLDPTVVATVLVWGWYAGGLWLRLVSGVRGRLVAIIGVVGFAGLIVLIGSSVALQRWHGFVS
jgi:ABC-type uncharacterized transport system permease subunit